MKKDFIWKFVSKDKTRYVLNGIYMDKEHEMAVASDAFVLLASKSLYDSNKATKVVFKNGETINTTDIGGIEKVCRYPNWYSILPKEDSGRVDLIVNGNLNKLLKCASEIAKLKAFKGFPIYVNVSKSRDIWVNYKYGKLMTQFGLDGWSSGVKIGGILSKRTSDGVMLVVQLEFELVNRTADFISELIKCGIAVPSGYSEPAEQAEAIQVAINNGLFNDR